MRKGHYLFLECGSLSKKLIVSGLICFGISLVLIIKGAEPDMSWYLGLLIGSCEFRAVHAWILFFLMLGLVLMIADLCIRRVCSDVAALLIEIDQRRS